MPDAEALVAKVQLSGSEKRALILWVLAGIVGLWYAQRHFFEAFPEASVNFKVTRAEALERARNFVESLGNSTASYRSVIVFGVNDNAKTYLEREVGLKEANRLMESEVNVWNWNVRFFKPEQEEEFFVGVSPEGNITGYSHKVPEARAGAEPARETAQQTAQNFLATKLGKAAADWDFLPEQANSTKKPNRVDWSFTWEKHGFKAKDAPERLTIALNGAEVGAATETLKVPEQWERDYRQLRSTNEFYNTVAIIPYLLLLGGVLWYGIQLTRRGQTSWRLALQLGVIVAILLTAMQLNRWPLEVFGYDTDSPFGSFAIQQVLGALAFGIASALTVTLVLPGGEPFYREAKPHFLRLKKALAWRGLRTKEFFSSVIVGLSLAGAHMGFLVAFYLIANHFGAWSPQEVNYEDSVSTLIPWIGGIAIGLLAATSEEFLFRLFAIPFLQKVTKSRVLAVILPAFSWGFLHTAYPNEPPYIRGLEVGLIGIVAGVVMLRWGILATLVWHYTVDAALVGLLLIRSSSLYFKLSGLVVGLAILIPFSYTVYSRIKQGSFEEDVDLLNSAPDPEDAAAAEEAEAPRELSKAPTSPLSKGVLAFLAVCILLGGFAALKIKPTRLGDYLKLSVNAKEASARASEILQRRGVDPKNYKSVTTFVDVTDATASEYLRRKLGVKALNDIYANQVPGARWDIRFFRDGQAEEYSVILRPDGELHSVHHDLAEAAKGAQLSKEEAIAKATTYLQDEKKIDLSQWTLVDSGSEKRPNRIDHALVWQAKQPLDGTDNSQPADPATHAFRRIQVTVAGDEPTSYRTFIKIPDEWRRKQESQSIWRTLHSVFVACVALGLGIAGLIFFLREIKSDLMKQVPWRRFAFWGLFSLAAYVAIGAFGDRIPVFLSQYKTAVPLKFMYGALAIGFTVGAFFYLGLLVILFAMGWFFLKQAYGEVDWPGWRRMPRNYYRDALLIGLGGTAALIAVSRATEFVLRRWPTPHRSFPAGFGLDFDSYVPGISISATAVLHGLLFTAAIAAIGGFVLAHCKSPAIRALLFVAVSIALVSGWGSPADFLKQWLAQLIFLAVVVFGITRVVRMNLLGYFLVLAIPSLVLGAQELLSQPNSFYHRQGYIVVAALAALLLWPLVAWLTESGRPPGKAAATATGEATSI
jgi:membrane protease YdiL (CAAX protease family)